VRLERVGKRYGFRQPWIVRDVSLDLPAGRLVRVEGVNGSGKSTLLRVIAGVSAPSSGTVTGRPGTGYVPERFPSTLPFSARDYLTHLGRVHGLASQELAARIDACLDRLGGSELAEIPLRNMSKGMCQKVAVAQALLPSPGLLILDEAWTGLDAAARAALDGVVAERLADGGAVVFVDHDPARLAELGPERWQVAGGQVKVVAEAAAARVAGADAGLVANSGAGPIMGGAAGRTGVGGGAERAPGGAGPGAVSGPERVAGDLTGAGVIMIELSGYPPGSPSPAGRPGVLSVRRDGERLAVRAEPGASDSLLRALLAEADRVHVRSVRPEPAPVRESVAGPGSGSESVAGPEPGTGSVSGSASQSVVGPEPGSGPDSGSGGVR
jgi:ABC-2 type transport system ATP-binding protein